MNDTFTDRLFRSLGTHAVKEFSLTETRLKLVVAPWSNLDNEAIATFENPEFIFIEADSGLVGAISNLNLPWDIIRFDSNLVEGVIWEFGLCCSEIQVGFKSKMPEITF
ncbi:hypothetical protein J8M21_22260 [Pseudoalteromonas luteoviolacea]|uniref:hypothetical protein n=1 Tax=Pseudoalteromonas luteoviolacea TaxID=43657 RepID=UPI001B3A740F|nr:hypothetical protein [Pseudoalteromonas luteoviolacea]MBQ4879939.1 hypothetical protein [Pseudoalteromonas luteoviolacea]MBQ4908956.1 hypothetical protein [Pseudoalteromonas luteoviolacea]